MEKELEWVHNCQRILSDIDDQLALIEDTIKNKDGGVNLNVFQLRGVCHTLITLKNQINAEVGRGHVSLVE